MFEIEVMLEATVRRVKRDGPQTRVARGSCMRFMLESNGARAMSLVLSGSTSGDQRPPLGGMYCGGVFLIGGIVIK